MKCRVIAGIVAATVSFAFASTSTALADWVLPVAAPYYSGNAYSDGFGIGRGFDNNFETQAVILDDTPTGSNPNTMPAYAGGNTTGHVVFDLGEVRSLTGSQLFGWEWNDNGTVHYYNPKDVAFYLSNAAGEKLDTLATHTYGSLTRSQSETVSWTAVSTRYLGMQVNSGYEEGSDGANWNYQFAEIQFQTASVPEPATISLVCAGLFGLLAYAWRKRR